MNDCAILTEWPFQARRGLEVMADAVNDTPSSAEQFARLAQAGDAAAFEQLVSLHEARIFNYLCQMTGHVHDAQDLTQVTFVKAYRSLARFDPRLSFSTWLFTIAKRTMLNHFRDTRRTEELTDDERMELQTPATDAENRDEQASVWETARRLPRDQFEALWLRYAEGFSIAETARAMETNQVRVRVLLHRGRRKLAKLLRPARPQ